MIRTTLQPSKRTYSFLHRVELIFWLFQILFSFAPGVLVFGANNSTSANTYKKKDGVQSGRQLKIPVKESTTATSNAKPTTPLNIPLTVNWVPLIAAHNSHHVNIYIGSPPQRRLVIVDTGSRTLVLPCKPCQNCGNKHFSKENLDLNYSSTDVRNLCNQNECTFVSGWDKSCKNNNECNFKLSYSEGSSIQGFELEDIVWLGTNNFEQSTKVHMQTAVPLSFGCESHETGIIADQYADGIMGLISSTKNQDNIVDVMHRSGIIPNYAFSMCLTKTGGVLSLGGTSLVERHLEPMEMVPLLSSNYYTVEVKGLYVGDIQIGADMPQMVTGAFNDGKGTVIDSGTTDTFLPSVLKRKFDKAWKKFSHAKHTNKWQDYTFEQFQKLPNVTIELSDGYMWVIQPHAFMEEVSLEGETEHAFVDTKSGDGWKGNLKFVSRIYLEEQMGAVLGSNAMIDHDITFDIGKWKVGIAKAKCHEK